MHQIIPRLSSILQCPYCHGVLVDQENRSCEDCSTKSHEECLDLHGQCPVFGCVTASERRIKVTDLKMTDDEARQKEIRKADWILTPSALIFALSSGMLLSAISKICEEGGFEASEFTKLIMILFGSWDGWSALLITSVVLGGTWVLAKCFANHRKNIYLVLFFFFCVLGPAAITIALFSVSRSFGNKL